MTWAARFLVGGAATWRPVLVAVVALAAGTAGCVEIDGGAVEVSWAIFARDGRAINDCACVNPRIGFVRLQIVAESDPAIQPCAGNDACRFSCARKTGATPFLVAAGQYLMSVVAVAPDGTDIPTTVMPGIPSVQTPAAQSRAVVRGQPTELEASMLEADCASSCDAGGIFSACTGG